MAIIRTHVPTTGTELNKFSLGVMACSWWRKTGEEEDRFPSLRSVGTFQHLIVCTVCSVLGLVPPQLPFR